MPGDKHQQDERLEFADQALGEYERDRLLVDLGDTETRLEHELREQMFELAEVRRRQAQVRADASPEIDRAVAWHDPDKKGPIH